MQTAFSRHALPGVRALTPYQPGKPIEELQRELGLADVIKLASNENPLGASPLARAAVNAALDDLQLYPDGSGYQLKQALSAHLGVVPEQITLGNGSNELLELLARVFLAPGRAALFSEYAFAVYPLVTQASGAESQVVPALPAGSDMPFGHDLAAFRRRLDDRVRLVFIANPNNPTGTWLPPAALETFLAEVPPDVIVVLDEAYHEYMEPEQRPDSLRWLQRFPNLVITRTFSKIYGLAGLRAGYALSHPELADLLNRARQPFNVNSLALAGARAALADQAHVTASAALNRTGLVYLAGELTRLGLDFLPSQANFLSFSLRRPAMPVYEGLLRQGVILRPLASYAMPEYLRITVGTAGQNARFVAALQQLL